MEQNTNRTECKNTKIQPPYRPLPLLLSVSLLAQAFSDPVADLTRWNLEKNGIKNICKLGKILEMQIKIENWNWK